MHTIQDELETWSFATNSFIGEINRMNIQKAAFNNRKDIGHLAVTSTTLEPTSHKTSNRLSRKQRCYNRTKLGHYSRKYHHHGIISNSYKRNEDHSSRTKVSKSTWDSVLLSNERKFACPLQTLTQKVQKAFGDTCDGTGKRTRTRIIVDSGASRHVVNDRRCMTSIEQVQPRTVELDNWYRCNGKESRLPLI